MAQFLIILIVIFRERSWRADKKNERRHGDDAHRVAFPPIDAVILYIASKWLKNNPSGEFYSPIPGFAISGVPPPTLVLGNAETDTDFDNEHCDRSQRTRAIAIGKYRAPQCDRFRSRIGWTPTEQMDRNSGYSH
jgi:hypothetical protein